VASAIIQLKEPT
jgi:hypothetical protein